MFSSIFNENSEYSLIKSDIESRKLPMGIIGLSNVHKAHYISSLLLSCKKTALIICDTEGAASRFVEDLQFFGVKAFLYPRREFSFDSSAAPSLEFQRRRIGVLSSLIKGEVDCVVSTLEAASQYTIPPKELQKSTVSLSVGDEIAPSDVIDVLLLNGYGRSDLVENPGQFSSRGEILDFFPPESDLPVRIEFWGDEINQLSYFDPDTQRRGDPVDSISVIPSLEIVCDALSFAKKLLDFSFSYKRKNASNIKSSVMKDVDLIQNGLAIRCPDKYISLIYDEHCTLFDYFEDSFLFVCESRSSRLNFENWSREFDSEIKDAKARYDLAVGFDEFYINK